MLILAMRLLHYDVISASFKAYFLDFETYFVDFKTYFADFETYFADFETYSGSVSGRISTYCRAIAQHSRPICGM
jgi:hypothetical protein